jgi:hypothetical protein
VNEAKKVPSPPPSPTTACEEPSFDPLERDVYERALDALDKSGVPFLLGGAFAFNYWSGIWRTSKDLDVFVRPGDATRALDALDTGGFRTEVVYESWLGKGWMGDIFVDVIWRNANALFPVTDEWLEHAPKAVLLGREVRTLPLEEAILSKIMVGGRHRFDGADILHMLHASAPFMDWDRLAEGAGEHVELLLAYLHMYRWGYPAWADQVPGWVLAKYGRLAAEHAERPSVPFRARLLDIPSFQADVDGWGLPDPHKMALAEIFGTAEGHE